MKKTLNVLITSAILNVIALPVTTAYAGTDNSNKNSSQVKKNMAAFTSLDNYLEQLNQHNKFIGSIGYYQNGELQYQYASKLEQNKITSTGKTLKYRVGSISKTFTSVMILQLIEEGKLSLDSKLAKFYPKVANANTINIAHMLNHHSGIRSYTNDAKFMEISLSPQSSQTIINMIEAYDSAFEPGSKGEYSNSNYYLLGQIIEKVTNQSYQDNLTSRITDKLGLKNTYYGGKIIPKNNEVNSYFWHQEQWQQAPESDMSWPHGAGALVSSTADLNRFIFALFNGKLINQASLNTMLTIKNDFGKGIFKYPHADGDAYGHDGAIDQFKSKLIYQPATKKSIAILSNGQQFDNNAILSAFLTAESGELVQLPNFNSIELAVAQLNKFTGKYSSDSHPLDITVFIEDKQLFAQADGQGAFPLTATSEYNFTFLPAGIEINFIADKAEFVIKQLGRADTFVRSSKLSENKIVVANDTLQAYTGVYKNPDFPLDISVFIENDTLMAQATGQGAFPLTATSTTAFRFAAAGIVIEFEQDKKQLTLSQGGVDTVMNKS